jgi:NADH:ubiquinone oxidoreductase subunit 5 (subunit L)/multisubunit Na+/H+ antiporter MnhA subunit
MHNLLLNVWLVPALPLWAAVWIALGYVLGFNRNEAGEKDTARTSLTAITLSLVLLLGVDGIALIYGEPGPITLGHWLRSGNYQVAISFGLDSLGLIMGTVVALICLMVMKFSVNYMHREAGFQRFFMVLNLFACGMLLIVLSGNAVFTFIGWELAGVSSYLLIGYMHQRDTATANATQAMITNRIGDAGFMLAIILSFIWVGSVEWQDINHNSLSLLHTSMIALGLLLAAMAKSAMAPFSPWIARALEGPTPSSAVFYGSLMVHAGVYLLVRMEPLFMQDPALLPLLVVIGAVTFAYGFLGGLVQTDVKSALMFSVTSQVGLMVFLCGIGLFDMAAGYMVLHALFRAWQFLISPSFMHNTSAPPKPVTGWLARQQWLYTAALQGFWLNHLGRWLLVRPAQGLGRDARNFDENVVQRIVGLPAQASMDPTLTDRRKTRRVGTGRGMAGKFMQTLASLFGWFEEHLVLKGGGESLTRLLSTLGGYMAKIETLLSQPRYLLVLILATFIVILT